MRSRAPGGTRMSSLDLWFRRAQPPTPHSHPHPQPARRSPHPGLVHVPATSSLLYRRPQLAQARTPRAPLRPGGQRKKWSPLPENRQGEQHCDRAKDVSPPRLGACEWSPDACSRRASTQGVPKTFRARARSKKSQLGTRGAPRGSGGNGMPPTRGSSRGNHRRRRARR